MQLLLTGNLVKFFKISEFDCQYSGKNEMNPDFLEMLDHLRSLCGFPFVITSGYRDPSHPIEARKDRPGTHAKGIAADIAIYDGAARHIILKEAINMGFNGIGVAKSFIHVDGRAGAPVIWTYN